MGKALGNGCFANARFADKAGIILLAAVQNLHHPLDLLLPANDGIQLALPGAVGKVNAVIIQKLSFFLGFAALGLPAGTGSVAGLPFRRGLIAAE